MSVKAPESVLKRKAGAGRARSGAGAPAPARALGQAFAKSAQDLMKLPVTILDATEVRMSLSEIPECLTDRALLAMLEGPADGLGLMTLAPELLSSLIEMQTTGKIGTAEVATRKPTRTDAAISSRVIDRVLLDWAALLANDPAITWAGGFRYSSFLDDPRPLGLILEDTAYRVIRLTVGLGIEAQRRGMLMLALPADGRGKPPVCSAGGGAAAGAADPRGEGDWERRIEAAVMGARTQLEAVVERVPLPLSDVLALAPGSLLTLSKGVVNRVRIEGRGRHLITYGKLGQCQGSYAVRLHFGLEAAARAMTGLADLKSLPAAAVAELQAAEAEEASENAESAAGRDS